MKKFNQKIWVIFCILVFLSTVSLGYLVNDKRNELLFDLKHQQSHLTNLFNNEITVFFSQFDSILDLLARHYKSNHNVNLKPVIELIEKNPVISNVYFFSAKGEYIASTGSPDDTHLHETGIHFNGNINLDRMLIGKPVYLADKNDWLIPVKKGILTHDQQIIAVVDMHLSQRSFSKAWKTNFDELMVEITSGDDLSPILKTNSTSNQNEIDSNSTFASQRLKNTLTLHKTQIETSPSSISSAFFPSSENTSEKSVAFIYNQQYKLWISTTYSTQNLDEKLNTIAISYLLIYLFVLLIFWGAFKWIIILSNKAYSNLTYTNEHNNLTGLHNRRALSKHITEKQQNKQSFTLLYLNLINFKIINDTFGYQYGDTILKEVAKRITDSFSDERGLVTHFSGDDFVILMDTVDREIITTYLNKLLALINQPYHNLYNSFAVSASVGVVPVSKSFKYLHHSTLDKLINYSEKVMMIAKHDPLKYTFFSELIYEDTRSKVRYEEALTGAINNGELSLVYQPQLNKEDKLIGVEALVRWKSPQLGNISPEIFIPIAEELNLMPLLGQFVIENALHELTQLQEKLHFSCSLSVNVSAQQLLQQTFLASLLESYQCHQSPYLDFIVEITENIFIENIDHVSPIFKTLKDYNIALSLDDFGTGFSSLSMLKNLPVDELKIDKSFIDNIVTSKVEREILNKIIDIGKVLDLKIVAEGVETKEQLTILKEMKCDILQGFYHSKPLKIDELELFILNNKAES